MNSKGTTRANIALKDEHLPVAQAEKQISPTKHQELLVKQLVDAPLPPEQESGETTEPGVGHFQGVGDGHVWRKRTPRYNVWYIPNESSV